MTTLFQAALDEQAARTRQRALTKAQQAASRARTRERTRRFRDLIRATASPRCRCQLHPAMTNQDLRALGAGCTHPWYVCPRLDTIRRRLGA